MRNSEKAPGRWGQYVLEARKRRGLTQTALARLLKVDRATVYRWESRQQRPESAQTVAAVAGILALDVDQAMFAAGLRLDPDATVATIEPYDEELELIRSDPKLSPEMKVRLADMVLERRERALEETKRLIQIMREAG